MSSFWSFILGFIFGIAFWAGAVFIYTKQYWLFKKSKKES